MGKGIMDRKLLDWIRVLNKRMPSAAAMGENVLKQLPQQNSTGNNDGVGLLWARA